MRALLGGAKTALCVGLGIASVLGGPPYSAASTGVAADSRLYVVVLERAPLASYSDGANGPVTTPVTGRRFRVGAAVRTYREVLIADQQGVLRRLGDPPVLYSYTTALNGFAAELDATQVKQLQSIPGVLDVQANEIAHLDRVTRPAAIVDRSSPALADEDTRSGASKAAQGGHGVVIGVIDSGIWPENPSFAGLPLDQREIQRTYPGFSGRCQSGERWTAAMCNDKVIAAQYFVRGFGPDRVSAAEYTSPRDGSGHGSHTAATAAGNAGVAVTIEDQKFGRISGTAPGAALSVYKACWAAPDPRDDGCSTVDTLAAIDRAVRDGVDVISYSLSGAQSPSPDVVDLAFLNAASAGVSVVTSAGDGGPGPSSIASVSPWVTTVGASTLQGYQGVVGLGNGAQVVGSMASQRRIVSRPVVYAGDVPAPGSDVGEAALCVPGSLAAAKVDTAIVVCDRGAVARVTKSTTVLRAGGVAMILANDAPGSTDTDIHAVPTVQVTMADGQLIKEYVTRSASPTATLRPSAINAAQAHGVADFSARGPVEAAEGDVLKPDITAPGVAIVSAVAPPSNFGRLWDLYSGTSMAAPQVAGLSAVLRAVHPRWSPALVKSALMTTATDIDGASPLASGAGEVAPDAASDPGLAYPANHADWLIYLRGQRIADLGDRLRAALRVDPTDLNQPSISIGSLVNRQEVQRRVTNVSSTAETYVASVQGLRGIAVSVSPSSFQLPAGQSRTFTVSFTAKKSARYNRFAEGQLVWAGSDGHVVRSPVTIRPEAIRAPSELTAALGDRHAILRSRAGVTGTIRAAVVGPVGATPLKIALTPARLTSARPHARAGAYVQPLVVPADTAAVRVELDSGRKGDDVDLSVYRGPRLVASATTIASNEVVTLPEPDAGHYTIVANAPDSDSTDVVSAQLTSWVLTKVHRRGLRVTPRRASVTGGKAFSLGVHWSGLSASQRWLGAVTYEGSDSVTYVTID